MAHKTYICTFNLVPEFHKVLADHAHKKRCSVADLIRAALENEYPRLYRKAEIQWEKQS